MPLRRPGTSTSYYWPLGDSNTLGTSGPSFRIPLETRFHAEGRKLVGVGTVTTAGLNHEGHAGFASGTMVANMAAYYAALQAPPDWALCLLGVNDAAGGVALATYRANMQAIVDFCLARMAAIVVIKYPLNTAGYATPITSYNAEIDVLTGSPDVCDAYTGSNANMLADTVHFNLGGEDFVAGRIYGTLRARGIV